MKKVIALLLVMVMMLGIAACADTQKPTEPSTKPSEPAEQVMTYAEYAAAADEAKVVVEGYVQATQGWWDNSIVIYAQDKDGAYFGYKVVCSEEDAAKLIPGTKIRMTGYKTFYKGMPELAEGATFTFIEGADTFIADPEDVTSLMASEDLVKKAGIKAAFKGATVAPSTKKDDTTEYAFLYNWDGSGEAGSDLYFNVSIGDKIYNFCVESYLTGADTEVYKAVEALKVGDKIDLEGFLYWYDGVNPHITSVTPVVEG
ncbi:MAG: hypothetical protein E7454_00225 [Ruminococcaceae bacterium]|nr:hypothetical protein [Oscillospiraceae bacterium]